MAVTRERHCLAMMIFHYTFFVNQIGKREVTLMIFFEIYLKKRTNYPISSNNHHSATADKAIHTQTRTEVTKPTGTSYNFDKA